MSGAGGAVGQAIAKGLDQIRQRNRLTQGQHAGEALGPAGAVVTGQKDEADPLAQQRIGHGKDRFPSEIDVQKRGIDRAVRAVDQSEGAGYGFARRRPRSSRDR